MEIETNKSYINRRLEVACWYEKDDSKSKLTQYAYMKKIRNRDNNIEDDYMVFKSSGENPENELLNIHSSLGSFMSTNKGKNNCVILHEDQSAISDTFNLLFKNNLEVAEEYLMIKNLYETKRIAISQKKYEIFDFYSNKIYGALISIKLTEKIGKIHNKFTSLSNSIKKGRQI